MQCESSLRLTRDSLYRIKVVVSKPTSLAQHDFIDSTVLTRYHYTLARHKHVRSSGQLQELVISINVIVTNNQNTLL